MTTLTVTPGFNFRSYLYGLGDLNGTTVVGAPGMPIIPGPVVSGVQYYNLRMSFTTIGTGQ